MRDCIVGLMFYRETEGTAWSIWYKTKQQWARQQSSKCWCQFNSPCELHFRAEGFKAI